MVFFRKTKNEFNIRQPAFDNTGIFIPADTWHNVINIGTKPIKLYSIYAPPNHSHGTIHSTKDISDLPEKY